jgi:uncharacterized protein YbjT (DUF2867 family)
MPTVLVTASSGNAGKHAVEALSNSGFNVIATSRKPEALSFPKHVKTRRYDADAATDFDLLLDGVDYLVLVGPPLDGDIHQKLTPLIKAAASKKIEKLVYLSGNYLSGFSGKSLAALSVRKVELEVIESGIPYAVVRAGFFMDNYLSGFYAPMVEKGQITLAVADAKSAFVSAADVGEFIAEVLLQDLTGEHVVTGPQALDHTEVASLLSQKLSRPITYVPISESDLISLYKTRNLPPQTAEYGVTLYRAFRNYATAAITDSFEQVTGRPPQSFSAFLGLT